MDNKKIIVKKHNLPGVDLSLIDISMLSAVKVIYTKVVAPMYKKGHYGYIALKDRLDDGDVIKVGDFGMLYRSLKQERFSPEGGILHKVKRVDNFNITSHDLNGIHKGDTARITNRRSYDQIFAQISKPYLP